MSLQSTVKNNLWIISLGVFLFLSSIASAQNTPVNPSEATSPIKDLPIIDVDQLKPDANQKIIGRNVKQENIPSIIAPTPPKLVPTASDSIPVNAIPLEDLLNGTVQSQSVVKSNNQNNLSPTQPVDNTNTILPATLSPKVIEQNSNEYVELKQKLIKFLEVSGLKVPEELTQTKNPALQNNNSSPDSLKGIVAQVEDNSTINSTENESDDAKIIESLVANNKNLTPQKIASYAGSCLLFPKKIVNCESYSCTMPSYFWGEKGDKTTKSIKGYQDESSCNLDFNISYSNPQGKDFDKISCHLSSTSRRIISEVYNDYFASGGISPKFDHNVSKSALYDRFKKIMEGEECQIKLRNGKTTTFSENEKSKKQNNVKEKLNAFEGTDIFNPDNSKQDVLSESDKAYFEMLRYKSKSLPANERLSDEETKAFNNVEESMLASKKQSRQNLSSNKVELYHNDNDEFDNLDNTNESSSKNSNSMHLSIKDTSNDEAKLDIKLQTAYKALMSEQFSAAITLYKTILEESKTNKQALFGLATSYHKNRQLKDAREIYTKILAIDPNDEEALNNFLVLIAAESPDSALIELKKLERISPDFSPICAQIGMIYLKLKDYEKAERYLRRAVSLSPTNVSYRYNLAITLDQQGKIIQAINLYKDILAAAKDGAMIPGSIEQISDRLAFLQSKL